MEDGELKICSMHFSVADSDQADDEYFPLLKGKERFAKEKIDLVFSTIAGGLIGVYVKEDHPLYFINKRMVDYLGYENESDFMQKINFKLSNSIHKDDR